MLAAYANSFKIPELRNRLLFTFGIIALCRVTSNIPCPGVDPKALAALFDQMADKTGGGVLNMFNLFSGHCRSLRSVLLGSCRTFRPRSSCS